ncbi:MAG: hypothetical protein KDI19_11530 [Pseudomonadales bacterium]|nr:hypothetical protein [Pseudomonadales bacterium]
MTQQTLVDEKTGRKYFLDAPADTNGGGLTLILSLHGGGSVGHWQREYFPAYDHVDKYRLVILTPSAATKEPARRWVAEADDDHLRNIVSDAYDRFGTENIRAFWLVGHSQGGMTSNRLLADPYFSSRVDGWLSLSGGRIGPIEIPEDFFAPFGNRRPMPAPSAGGAGPGRAIMPDTDFSFIFATGEHEMVALPETSPWAEKYGAGARQQLPDVVDTEPGKIYDTSRDGKSSKGWGLRPRPGTAQIFVYPGAAGGRVIADVVRLDKGHTEGLEPRITEELIKIMVSAPGGKYT